MLDGLFAEAEPQGPALLRVDHHARPDRAHAQASGKLDYVRLDGSVPQKKRQVRVNRFREDPRCRLFMATNAGSTGLNLQAANTVINVDLPWNPAVLEQRIGRAHRMGQQQPVQVYVLVTEETIEENLLATLSAKHDLALAALDPDSDVTAGRSGQRRGGAAAAAGGAAWGPARGARGRQPRRNRSTRQAAQLAEHRDRVAAAGGEMLGAVFNFLGELVAQDRPHRRRRAGHPGPQPA